MPICEIQNCGWKPVNTDKLRDDEHFENLIGIEECTSYDNVTKDHTGNRLRLGKVFSTSFNTKKTSNDRNKKQGAKKIRRKKKSTKKTEGVKEDTQAVDFTPSKDGSTLNVEEDIDELRALLNEQQMEHKQENDKLEDVSLWNNFGLPKPILKGLAAQKFSQPTPIQALTLPAAILGRRDILGAAETGSGKTLAFGLPILTEILRLKNENKKKSLKDVSKHLEEDEVEFFGDKITDISDEEKSGKALYALILTPTRELAFQIKRHLSCAGKFTGIKIATIVGGMAAVKQERILKQCPEIVVATPGRLWELIESKNEHLSHLNDVQFLVIDETDRMIEKGHFQELHDILEKLNADEEKIKKRQNFVFSATLTLVHELPKYLAMKKKLVRSKKISELTPIQKLQNIINLLGITEPKIVDISRGKGTSSTLTESRILCSFEEKDYYLYYFLQKHPGRTLIFCNSIGCVKRVTTILSLLNLQPLPLHAAMQQRQRLKNLDKFTEKDGSILVATDVAARGLDIPNIAHVLHYQTPRTSESYVHRSGRTARASKEGITVLLMEPSELQSYLKFCKTLGKENDMADFPINENILKCVKERVDMARELDAMQLKLKKKTSEMGWYQKAAEEMDIVIDDLSSVDDSSDLANLKRSIELKRKHLAALFTKNLFPKGFSGKYPMNANNIPLTEEFSKQEKAVDVMRDVLEQTTKKKFRPLYKAKRKITNESEGELRIPRKQFKMENKKWKQQ